jgi:MFS family permease
MKKNMQKTNSNNKQIYLFLALLLIEGVINNMPGVVMGPVFLDKENSILSASVTLGTRNLLYGLVSAVFPLCFFFGSIFMGGRSDKIGRKNVLWLSFIGIGAGYVVVVGSLYLKIILLFIFGRMINGFFNVTVPVTQAALIDISSSTSKTFYLGLASIMSYLGFIIGPLLSGALVGSSLMNGLGIKTPFITAVLLATGSALLIYFGLKQDSSPSSSQEKSLAAQIKELKDALASKKIMWISILSLLGQGAWALYLTYLPLFLVSRYECAPTKVAEFLAYAGLFNIATFLVVVPALMKLFHNNVVLIIGLALCAGSLIISGLASAYPPFFLAMIPVTVGSGITLQAVLHLLSDSLQKQQQGLAMGLANGTAALASFAAACLLGISADINIILPFFLAGSIAGIAGIIMCYLIFSTHYFERRRRPAE